MQSLCDILKFFHVKTKSICGKAARFNYSSKRSHRKHQLSSLPTELLYTLFTYIPVQEFLNLCRSGIHMRTKIRLYLQTAQFVDHFSSLVRSTVKQFSIEELVRLERPKCYKDTFTAFGRLIRICYSSTEKQTCAEFLAHFYLKCCRSIRNEHQGWGLLFNELIRNWTQSEELEFMRNFLAFSTQLENGIQLLQNEDSLAVERLQFRRFIQHSFLDFSPIENARYRFRLSAILHIFNELLPNADLRLLFLLGAPIAKTAQGVEFIDSGQMHTKLVENQEMLLSVLGRLPELVSELVHTQDLELIELRWTDLRVFHLIENLTTTPEPWTLSAFSAFLVSSPVMARLAIVTRAINDNVAEAGNTLYNCVESTTILRWNALATLRPTIQSLLKHCQPVTCLSVLREAIVCAHHHLILEAIPPNLQQYPEDLDLGPIRQTLEINSALSEIGKCIVG